jgi:hypothetical protein
MPDYSGFKSRHTVSRDFGKFSQEELASASKKLPAAVIDFLATEGRVTYSEDFLWNVLPDDLDFTGMYNEWGLPGEECYTFMRSALGVCLYYRQGNYYYLNPVTGVNGIMFDDFDFIINTYMIMDVFISDSFAYPHYIRLKAGKPELKEDEIYGFIPAIALGGSYETSSLEVVKMFEHLAILAALAGNTTKEI